jgi:ectoine hydroxylase-related dioxygenase (phytanoyl-CoA dioxygenase family)
MELGSLCICVGSHRFDPLLQTYGQMDISKDRVKGSGWFSEDPVEIVEKFGGRWATTDFQAGDAIIFGMFTLHMSTVNQTGRYRTSCDTRYQLRSEPIDERFMGSDPVPPSFDGVEREVTMEQLRDRWML